MGNTVTDYRFCIKPYGIPKLSKILKFGYLVNEFKEIIPLENFNLNKFFYGGIKLIDDFPNGVYYEFYVEIETKVFRSVSTNASNTEKLLDNLKIDSRRKRIERGGDSKRIYVWTNSENL